MAPLRPHDVRKGMWVEIVFNFTQKKNRIFGGLHMDPQLPLHENETKRLFEFE